MQYCLTQQALIESQQQAIDDLYRIDKLKDEFLANTSHELRTPLNGIISLAENMVISSGEHLPEKTQIDLALIINSGKRLFNLIDDILDYSKLKNNDIVLRQQSVDLYTIVETVTNLLQQLLVEKRLVVKNQIVKNIQPVYADENRLQQILYNLVGNAIKFSEQGTIVITALEKAKQMGASQGFIEISISDNGIGIPQEHIGRIFESFEQADGSVSRIYGGTGVGLSIVKKLVNLHKGTIRVTSSPGEGSCFTFSLPMAGGGATDQIIQQPLLRQVLLTQSNFPANISEENQPEGNTFDQLKENILVVDDDPTNRYVIGQLLSNNGYNVFTAISGVEALDMVRNKQSTFF